MARKKLYRIRFRNDDKVLEIYARSVTQGDLFGFIEVSGIEWGQKSEVIIDPTEQEVRNELAGVKAFQVPLHAVVRVDEVEKQGSAKIVAIPATDREDPPVPMIPPAPKPRKR